MNYLAVMNDIFEVLTSKTAIAVYVVIFAILVIIISIATVFDIRKKFEFKNKYRLEKLEDERLKSRSRFPELVEIDRLNSKGFRKIESTPNLTLKMICEQFQNYNSAELKLYFSIEDIRKFVSGLAVSKTMILQGMSGTGKTSLAVAFGKFISVPSTVVPIQPMWKERSDLLGYYNEFTGRFNETMILQRIYEAAYSDRIFIIILDELNIARVEYYFAEFLSLLELPPTSARRLVVTAAGVPGDPKNMKRGNIILPNNVWFLGTANNDDSTFAISDKVYDRAMIMNLDNRAEAFPPKDSLGKTRINLSVAKFMELVSDAQRKHQISEDALGKIQELDEYLIRTFHVTFGNRILMQIHKYVPVYIMCGGSEMEAIDDILAKKTLRKLEAKNPVYIKAKSQELIGKLDEIFGQDVMVNCIEYVNRIVKNA